MTDPRPCPLEPLIQDHAAFLERLARSLVGDRERASDLVQETWAAALTKWTPRIEGLPADSPP